MFHVKHYAIEWRTVFCFQEGCYMRAYGKICSGKVSFYIVAVLGAGLGILSIAAFTVERIAGVMRKNLKLHLL